MTRNIELGNFLRSRRSRLKPGSDELVNSRRRRTPGLRREEVAAKIGISTEWYTKIEQGRVSSLSRRLIDSLGKALELNQAEIAHLRALTERKMNGIGKNYIPEGLVLLVKGLSDPAYITNERWDVVIWNTAAAELITDFSLLKLEDRNIMVFMLTTQNARTLFGDTWESEARRMISLFHVNYALHSEDELFEALVRRFDSECPEFKKWWSEHAIAAPVSGKKMLTGKDGTRKSYWYSTFISNDASNLKLSLYTSES